VTKSYGLRGCFRAAADAVLVVGDWSAAHLWLAAAFSGDPVFAADLTDPPDGRDPYQRWAIEAGAPVDRATAKRQVLALLNGAGTARLAVIGAVPATRVRGVAARWFRRYGVLRGYLQAARGAETWASSPAWCARTVDASDVPPYARPAWRWQAAEADALAVAVRWLHHEGARVVLTVHDEIVVEAPTERAPAVVGLVHQAMADGFAAATGDTLVAPAVVSVRRTWGED
jgi:DNA polymerase-1